LDARCTERGLERERVDADPVEASAVQRSIDRIAAQSDDQRRWFRVL
jgi:hypothetical protein